jgi:urocanate hydratase
MDEWRDSSLVSEPSQKIPADNRVSSLQTEACGLYVALTRNFRASGADNPEGEPGLGGKLLWADELDARGRAAVIAANVAGCASLAAIADITAQKQSIRDGVVDFLVTSLDEAVRILKNEVRQRKTVAVCVGSDPQAVEREMMERGLLPDIDVGASPDQEGAGSRFGPGPIAIQIAEPESGVVFLTWRVEQASARWMRKLDAIALGCLRTNSWESRWLRLSPRFLGRAALAQRTVFCEPETAKEIARGIDESVQSGEIGVEVSVIP